MEIGFYSHVNTKPQATLACIQSVRKFYPNNKIVISCDAAYDFTEMCKEYNVTYHHNNTVLGYPTQPFGYRRDKVLEWLDRMYRGVILMSDTDYFIMLEDDVILHNFLTIDPEWEMAGQPMLYEGQVPSMPDSFLDIIEEFSGVRPKQNYYNCGGGSIFKTSTFLNNYENIRLFLLKNIDRIQDTIYPTLGWMDCFMCVYFLLCGKPLVENNRLFNNFPTKIPLDINTVPPGIEIIHNFKDYYGNN